MAEQDETKKPSVGVLTVSDRAFNGQYEDRGGPAVRTYVENHFQPCTIVAKVVPDEQPQIEQAILHLADTCSLVLTTGGTGIAPRDVTPEATAAVCQKMIPGLGEVMRAVSVVKVPTAVLSRQTAGVCGKAVVVNLPGNPKAVQECLDPILQALPHAVNHAASGQVLRLLPEFHVKGRKCGECPVTH